MLRKVSYQVAKELGIIAALGDSHEGKLALWQVFSRVLEQGSRLSAVRLGETYAIASTISIKRGFNEDDDHASSRSEVGFIIFDCGRGVAQPKYSHLAGNNSKKSNTFSTNSRAPPAEQKAEQKNVRSIRS